MSHSSGPDFESTPPSRSSSEIPLAIHARLVGTIAVAATVPSLLVFLLAHPTEVIESTALWFLTFPLTYAIAAGLFTPKVRGRLPDSYPATEDRRRLRNVGFVLASLAVAYAIATCVLFVSVAAGVVFPSSSEEPPLVASLFVALSAIVLVPLPSVYLRWKHRNSAEDFPFETRDRVITVALALFGGGLGLHKFYTGQRRDGAFYLLFCWTLIPWLLGLRAAFQYATMDSDEFARELGSANDEPFSDEMSEPSSDETSDSDSDETSELGSDEIEDPVSDETGQPVFDDVGERLSPETSESSERTWPESKTEPFEEDADEVTSSPDDSSSSEESTVDELERLYDLYEEGAITEDEYEQSKAELLGGL